ncbi:MAG: CoA-binding protein [Enterovirga sp.]|nr:CoA-binding protein [Enterovirga sp.]
MGTRLTTPAEIRDLLQGSRTIAIVGASTDPFRPSFGIARYLKDAGYRVIPVNPRHAGQTLHGKRILASLAEIAEPVDIVDVFRRPDAALGVAEEAIRLKARALWLQLGVTNEAAAQRAEEAGMAVVMNRCISVDHSRLAYG